MGRARLSESVTNLDEHCLPQVLCRRQHQWQTYFQWLHHAKLITSLPLLISTTADNDWSDKRNPSKKLMTTKESKKVHFDNSQHPLAKCHPVPLIICYLPVNTLNQDMKTTCGRQGPEL